LPKSPVAQKLRRALHPVYRRLETTVHPLRYLFLEITQQCNLHCRHCGSDCGKDPHLDELSTDEWLAFVDYLNEQYPKHEELMLVFTGGEPLCHPDLDLIFGRARERGFPFGMVTNGYLLDEANARRVVDLGITSVTVSLDGLAASHDWLRGVKGSFERAVRGIALLAASPIRFFDVVTCVNPRNIDELPRVQALLEQAGVRNWRLFSIFPKGRARSNDELLLTDGQLRRLLDWIAEQRPALAARGFTLDFSCEGYLPRSIDTAVRTEPYFCRAGIAIGSVLCDGAIAACPNISRALVQGNIRTDDFATVWEERYQPFRERQWMRQGPCVDCGEWKQCQGNSLHLWDAEQGRTALCYVKALAGDDGSR
jgi:radical SAM enzyme (rSAM/lipoprotein system)